ncbi:MAG: fibrobacter succinogenes major paralogous domain-containing protein [Chitinispirillia bacterium]|nr:fibrobacter succinogenes major paralogous domain-containing protein [Chitinispirillia bacterium]MCL2269392.1 fibrobacter succinogenes major paralogous domain-containing protein [Chitinispirillia bacterium]
MKSYLNSSVGHSAFLRNDYITSMTTTPKIHRPTATTLLALAALAVIAGGCGKTAERKDADTVQTAAVAPNVISGTFTDSRDGQVYRTVVIGTQTWMAENLNYKTGASVCYDNADSNCTKYGRLYDWDDAMTACPAPWRLPSDEDWDSLALAAGGQRENDYNWEVAGNKLKSTTGWACVGLDYGGKLVFGNGTDEFGFSALPGGWRGVGKFGNAGDYGYWWSATEYDATYASYRSMNGYFSLVRRFHAFKRYLYSVRCVQDLGSV